MKLYLAAAFICTVSLLATGCRRPLDDISAPLGKLTLEVNMTPLVPGLTAVDVEGRIRRGDLQYWDTTGRRGRSVPVSG